MKEKDFPYYLPSRKEKFVARTKELQDINETFKNSQTQIICICSFSGIGKTTLALEYAYNLKDESKWIPRWFNSNVRKQLEMEYKEFGDILDVKTESKSLKFIAQKVNFVLEKSNSNILFIFDDLDDYDSIEEIITGLPKNVKVLITTRNQNLNCFEKKLKIDLFNIDEAKLYLDYNVSSINDVEKDQLINTVKTKTNHVLPLKLNRLASYFKEFPLFTFNKMVQNSLKLNVQGIYFDELVRKSHEAFNLLHLCSFLKLDFVSFSFLLNLTRCHFNKNISEFKLHHLLNILTKLSFIKSLKINQNDGFSITHSFIQEEIQMYASKIKPNTNSTVVNEIAEFLIDSLNKTEVISSNEQKHDDACKQAIHLIDFLDNEESKVLISKRLHIDLTEKVSYYELLINNNTEKTLEYNLKCLSLRKEALDESHPDIIKSLNNIAVAYHNKGDFSMSLSFFLKIYEKTFDESKCSVDLADCMNNIGQLYSDLGDYKKSLDYNKRAYEMKKQLLDIKEVTSARNLAKSQSQLAISFRSLGDYKRAIHYFLKSFELLLNLFNQNSNIDGSMDLGNSLSNLGKLYHDLGDYKKSLEYNFKSYEIKQKLYELNTPLISDSLSDSLNSIATSFNSLGEYQRALEYFLKSLELKNKIFKEDHPDKADTLDAIGVVFHNLNRFEESLEYCLKAYEMRKLIYDKNHPCLCLSLQNIGIAYRNIGDKKKLLHYYLKAHEISENLMDSSLYVNLYSSSKDNCTENIFNKEELFLTQSFTFKDSTPSDSLEDFSKLFKFEQRDIRSNKDLKTFNNLINNSHEDYKKSLAYLLESFKIRQRLYNDSCHLDIAESLDNIATTYNCLGEYQTAIEYYRNSLKIKKSLFDQKHPDIGTSYNNIAIVYSNMEDYKNSLKYFLKSFKLKNKLNNSQKNVELKKIINSVDLIYLNLDDNLKKQVSRFGSFKKLNKYFKNFIFENISMSSSFTDHKPDLYGKTNSEQQKYSEKITIKDLFKKIENTQNCLNNIDKKQIVNLPKKSI